MRSFVPAFFALASLAHAGQKAFTGKGAIEVWTANGYPAGCLDKSGAWVREGQFGNDCAIFTSNLARVPGGVDAQKPFKLWADRNSTRGCEIQDGSFFCSPDISEPDELHRQHGTPGWLANPIDGGENWYAAHKPAKGSPSPLYEKSPSDDAIAVTLAWEHSWA